MSSRKQHRAPHTDRGDVAGQFGKCHNSAKMDRAIHIDRQSEIPVTEQLAAQLVYLIGSGQIRAGDPLPSVRALAMRLKVHRNTVHEAFQDVTLASLVEKGRGRRLRVRGAQPRSARSQLDALIDNAVAAARKAGYSPRHFYDRMHERLTATPPGRLLVVSEDPGWRLLIAMELRREFRCHVDECAPEVIRTEGARLIGALVVTTPASLPRVEQLIPSDQSIVSVSYTSIDQHVARVRALSRPSIIGVASISANFLELARRLLAPAVSRRHALHEYLIQTARPPSIGAVDLLFCDAVTYGVLRVKYLRATVVRHDMIAGSTFAEIAAALESSS